jgi:hypothetical protein
MPRRVAALYDIHGNLPALEAVLAEVRRADGIETGCGVRGVEQRREPSALAIIHGGRA